MSDDHHVVRHVSFQQIDRDDSGAIRGIFPQAFILYPKDQGYLSASWLEFFAGSTHDRVAAVAAFLAKTRKVTVKQAFACGRVGDIKEACAQFDQKIRVVHEPGDDNLAYTAIRRYQSDNIELLELLATEAWSHTTDAKDVIDLIGPWPRSP
ncbi:hypothetical protein MTX26_15880 [Bradyrhizobium sp. ISRA443]|uniref:hypothetical protein n=1 Tax=unclassified Bradyrhizobium TaxID=2631580 RepID=UPI002479CA0B|nr:MULTISPECIES: hypothetical protein [unclassified Bradyrhizobium]WGS02207.1 hypothetical protein MTX23_15890 [Bradyrhizobium sp. ISRA436]WGS09092.1 hypothetical protein MTX18_15880 [Bradyrhizobium sp. ISRA437]WGS15981.1 hypothetical protein MTX26_15880 [Bradyrhizobium sp. ISRA443]